MVVARGAITNALSIKQFLTKRATDQTSEHLVNLFTAAAEEQGQTDKSNSHDTTIRFSKKTLCDLFNYILATIYWPLYIGNNTGCTISP
jgi:hypothetical protein